MKAHYWIIERDGTAKCKDCGATKYYPSEKIVFKGYNIFDIKNTDVRYDTESWLNGRIYENIHSGPV